jgi:Phosphodiester glycosidase
MKIVWVGNVFIALVGLNSCGAKVSTTTPVLPTPTPTPTIAYQVDHQPNATIYSLVIPAMFVVTPVVLATTATVDEFARQEKAVAVINAGFFDPSNQLSTSYVTIQGKLVADPRQNDRLMQNPQLTPYLPQILARSEFRRYQCSQTGQRSQTGQPKRNRYDIVPHAAPIPAGCQLVDALGAGPQLLPAMTGAAEGFWSRSPGRDPLGYEQPNARSAVGIKPDGTVVWVMVQQSRDRSGLSLTAMASYLKTLGVEKALNLDGGSSSALFYNGQLQVSNVAASGPRPVKSVLIVRPL